MDYSQLAQWVGWPAVAGALLLVGFVGAFFYAQKDRLQLTQIELLRQKIKDLEQTTPDVLVTRLLHRGAILEQELASADASDVKARNEIGRLGQELEATKDEARSLNRQLMEAQRELSDFIYPRDGRVRQVLAYDILRTIDEQQAIYIPVRFGDSVLGQADPDRIATAYAWPISVAIRIYLPGMHKTYISLTTRERVFLGQVVNPYVETYERDYYETLQAIVRYLLHEDLPVAEEVRLGDSGDLSSALLFPGVSFAGVSPIEPTLGYYRFPVSATSGAVMNGLMGQYEYQGEWYVGFTGPFDPVG